MSSPHLAQKPSVARLMLLVTLILAALLLAACDLSDQRAIQTAAAGVAETAVAIGKSEAGTQVVRAKETTVAFAATQAVTFKETAVAAAATKAAELKATAEAEIRTRVAPGSGVDPEVQAAREQLEAMPAMKSHWTQVNAPIQNAPDQRAPERYAKVIDQFDVNSADLAGRYKSGGAGNADTRCNIFAGDVMRAMGVALPTKGNLGKGQGDKNAVFTDPMTAQAGLLNDYLNRRIAWVTSADDPGVLSDWVEVTPTSAQGLDQLVAHVNAGKPAVVSDAGHIAVVRPGQAGLQDWHDLIIAQAGLDNFLVGPLRDHFRGTPQFFIKD